MANQNSYKRLKSLVTFPLTKLEHNQKKCHVSYAALWPSQFKSSFKLEFHFINLFSSNLWSSSSMWIWYKIWGWNCWDIHLDLAHPLFLVSWETASFLIYLYTLLFRINCQPLAAGPICVDLFHPCAAGSFDMCRLLSVFPRFILVVWFDRTCILCAIVFVPKPLTLRSNIFSQWNINSSQFD